MTAGVLRKRSKTHKRLNRTLFNLTKQDKMCILSCFKCAFCLVWLKSILFHLLCVFDPHSLNGLSLPHSNASLCESVAWRVWVFALGLLKICGTCSVYWVAGQADVYNKKLIYTPAAWFITQTKQCLCSKKGLYCSSILINKSSVFYSETPVCSFKHFTNSIKELSENKGH